MKNLLFIAIIATALNVSAQSRQLQQPSFYSPKGIKEMKGDHDFNSPLTQPEEIFKQALSRNATAPRELIQLYDSIYFWFLYSDNSGWKTDHKYTDITYDANNNLTSYTVVYWNDPVWQKTSRYIYTFDAHNNQTSETEQFWENTDWQNYSLYTTIYDENDNLTIETYQNWENSLWVNKIQYVYTYDANQNLTSKSKHAGNGSGWENWSVQINSYDVQNNLVSEQYQQWQEDVWVNWMLNSFIYDTEQNMTTGVYQLWQNSAWQNSRKNIVTYDEHHNPLTYVIQTWPEGGNDWVNGNKYTYTFDSDNHIINFLAQQYNTPDSSWTNLAFYTYSYVNGNPTNLLYQTWDGSNWLNISLERNIYDVNNNHATSILEYWENGAWVRDNLSLNTFDSDNFTLSTTSLRWGSGGTVLLSGDSTYYYFRTVMGINDSPINDKSISLFPNPTTGKFTLSALSSINSIEIYNLNGDCIWSDYDLKRQTSKSIDLSASAKGIYFVKIKSGGVMHGRKIVIQ
jgi:hypothetical protein